MSYIGDFRLGDTFDTKFCTVNTSGVPTTLAGTPVISAYVGNSVTQITAGITLTVDFDAVTGLHNVRVVATGVNGYATASNYQLVITTGTVGGSSVVGYVVAEFSIEARSALMPTTAARTLDITATGAAGIDLANVENQGTTLGLTGTTIATVTTTTTATNLTNLPSIPANWITSAGITDGAYTAAKFAAASLNGKGDWNIGKTGYSLTAGTGLGNQTADITGSLSGSVGSVTGAVGSVTANVNAVLINGAHGGAAATATFGGAGGISSTLTGNVTGSVGSVTGAVGSVTGNVGGNVAGSVGSVTGLTAATVHSDLDDIQARLPAALVGGRMDSNLGAISTSATAADNLERSTLGIVTGTVGAGSTTTSIVTSALSPAAAVIDQYKGRIVTFDSATTTANLRGQSTDITTNTALGVLTVTALTTAPVSGDTFTIT